MRSKPEIVQEFVGTDPTPNEAGSVGNSAQIQYEMRDYRRQKLLLETMLDVRELLEKLGNHLG